MLKFSKFLIASILLLQFPLLSAADVKDKDKKKEVDPYFAIIGDQEIPLETFQVAFRKGVRQKFYHGKVAKNEVESFRKEVADKLVNQVLLTQEAKRRKIKIDKAPIDKKLAELDKRNSKQAQWAKNRDKVLAILREQLEREEYVKKFEKVVKSMAPPDDKKLKAYYEGNKDKFTAPQEWHVSLILLKVDPSSSSDVWSAAADEAADLVKRIRDGADFAELARIHSGDESAENGGDMGYLHLGMLAKPAQDVLNLMKPGEISEPVILLQGVAIFRLEGIKPASLNPLKKVKERAQQLWVRENGEKAWSDLVTDLRKQVNIKYGNAVFGEMEAAVKAK
jgi:parvulin-like peptidyl-prolyl isomerase